MERSQTDTEGNVTAESSSAGVSMEPSHYTKSGQPALEELTGEYEPWVVWVLVGKPLMQAAG